MISWEKLPLDETASYWSPLTPKSFWIPQTLRGSRLHRRKTTSTFAWRRERCTAGSTKKVDNNRFNSGARYRSVLYVEGESMKKILSEWARILRHKTGWPLFWKALYPLVRRTEYKGGQRSLFCPQSGFPRIRGVCLLDGDNRDEPDSDTTKAGLRSSGGGDTKSRIIYSFLRR